MEDVNAAIAKLRPDDWQELKAIRLEALLREPAAFSSTYAESAAQPGTTWRDRLASPQSVTLVARANGATIGMAGAHFGADGERNVAMIFGMYVRAAYRNHGVGGILLRALLQEIARRPEITVIRLWVTPTQHAAQRLYASLGFRIVADPDRSLLDGPDAHEEIAMERPVNKETS